jgi:hypothetical protein
MSPRRPRRLLRAVVVCTAALAMLVPASARSHTPNAHWIQLTPGHWTITYIDTFTGHCCFKTQVHATWSSVSDTCGYLHNVTFYYYDVQQYTRGGVLIIEDNQGGWQRWDADLGYYYPPGFEGYGPSISVERWYCYGQQNGRLAVLFNKYNVDEYCPDCTQHNSRTMFYR